MGAHWGAMMGAHWAHRLPSKSWQTLFFHFAKLKSVVILDMTTLLDSILFILKIFSLVSPQQGVKRNLPCKTESENELYRCFYPPKLIENPEIDCTLHFAAQQILTFYR